MSKPPIWRNPTIMVWSLLMLAFVVANTIFIYLAQTNAPSLVVDNYYERGQDYEKNMLKRMAQDPGWNMRIELLAQPVQQQAGAIRFHLSDSSGQLLVPDSVVLHAYRPSDKKQDFEQSMAELQNGVYQTEVAFPLPGIWDLLVVVTKDGQEHSEALRINAAKP